MSYHIVLDNLSDEDDWDVMAATKAEEQQLAEDVKTRIEITARVAQEMVHEFQHTYERFNVTLAGHVKQNDTDADTVNIAVSGILNPVEVLT